jgi:AhpD family alkylhydroperoxidase
MKNPLETFQKEYPELQQAYAGVINTLIKSNVLDAKTKQLIYIAMKVVTDDKNAVKYHVPMAKAVGATREEIKETIALSITINGLKGISSFLPDAIETYDKLK